MKIYINPANYEVYTEETVDKEITQRIKDYNYEGLLNYITDNFTEPEIFAMLSPDSQLRALEYLKELKLEDAFFEREVDEPLPCDKCPFAK